MPRQDEQVGLGAEKKPPRERADLALDEVARHSRAARRTAWIIGVIAFAFFIASLVEGHLVGIPH